MNSFILLQNKTDKCRQNMNSLIGLWFRRCFPLTSSALALLLLSNVAQSDGVSLVRFFPQEVSVTGQCLDHSSLEPLVGVSTVNSSIMENFNIADSLDLQFVVSRYTVRPAFVAPLYLNARICLIHRNDWLAPLSANNCINEEYFCEALLNIDGRDRRSALPRKIVIRMGYEF